MRQGKSSSDVYKGKTEPRPHGINTEAVSQIGQTLGNKATQGGKILDSVAERMHKTRGYSAPPLANFAAHKGGSQGRHE